MQIVSSEESGLPSSFRIARGLSPYDNVLALLINPGDNQLEDRGTRSTGMTLSSGRDITMSCADGCVSLRPALYLTKSGQVNRFRPMATAHAECTINGDTEHIAQTMQSRLYRAIDAALQENVPQTSVLINTTKDAVDGRGELEQFCRRVADIFCGESVNPPASDPTSTWDKDGTRYRVLDVADLSHRADLSDLRQRWALPYHPYSPEGLTFRDDSARVGLMSADGALIAMSSIGIQTLPNGSRAVRVVNAMDDDEDAARFRAVAASAMVEDRLTHLRSTYISSVRELATRNGAEIPITPVRGLSMLDTPEMLQSLVRGYAEIVKSNLADPSLRLDVISLDSLNGAHLLSQSEGALLALSTTGEDGRRQFNIVPAAHV